MRSFDIGHPLGVDAYQMGHFGMIPDGMENFQCAHVTLRKPLHWGDTRADNRLIFAGSLPYVLLELGQRLTSMGDVDEAVEFMSDFHAALTAPHLRPYPFPKKMWERVVTEFGGRLPICVMAMPDGQAHYPGEPSMQIWTDVPGMGELVGWIESALLPYIWTSSAVGTRGRIRMQELIRTYQRALPSQSVDELRMLAQYKFVDFGRRGGAASQITGIAHLLNFLSTDTVDAAVAAVKFLNGGQKFGACSIVAAAHRTVTPWPKEMDSIDNMVEKFGSGMFSFVADSYGFSPGIRRLASKAKIVQVKGGFVVGRPDSGDPVQCVLEGMQVFKEAFGFTTTETGLTLLNNSSILQADGISDSKVFDQLFPALFAHGFCPTNLTLGMGEYNHRAVRSDTEAALKTALVGISETGSAEVSGYRPVMKDSDSLFKRSIPGPVAFHAGGKEINRRIRPISVEQLKAGEVGDYRVIFDGRPNPLPIRRPTFSESRTLAWESWLALPPVTGDTIDPRIREAQREYLKRMAEAVA
jgi:nicotinic acid phosphoribosyltransferase